MKPIVDSPDVVHADEPIRHIDMSEMDAESIAFMLQQSRDDFYSNKELAPVREYSTNARDAHIQSGIPERPIEVTLPSQLSPELRIRDFGKGLTIDNLSDIYFKYWKSTKRGDNNQNGCLGIGAKSAFAYTAAYTVTTWCGGMKTVATGQKNGYADVIFHQPNVSGEPDGVEIVIPIQQKDIAKFVHEALELFKYWDIRPIFHNIEESILKEAFNIMDTKPFLFGEGWAVRPAGYGKGESKAIMGFVPYTIDWEQVKNSLPPEISTKVSGIFTFLEENLTALYFDNGTLSFTPNRESLQYNDPTISAISQKLVAIYESLLNLITSKIADAPNIWEAKIRYNQIFRRELDGFDKELMYGGNLNTLENLLRNRVQWNGITISSGIFEELDNWDIKLGHVQQRYNVMDFVPLFTTYVKDTDKTGIRECSSSRRRRSWNRISKIVASPKSVVIVQDTDKLSLVKGLARWFLYKASKEVSQVYVLDLSNPTVKDAFFKHYNFDTVPVSYVSQNELLVKAYLKSIRAPRGTGDSTDRESRPLYCPFVEIKSRQTHGYTSSPCWGYENVNARGIQGGGFFVVYSKNSFTYNGREITHCDSDAFWQAIYDLSEISDDKLTKVFGIHPKTAESAWFKEAIEEGNWTNLTDWVKENIDILPKDIIKKVVSYHYVECNRVGTVAAETLSPLLVDGDGVAAKYFKEIADFNKHWTTKNIPSVLRVEGWAHDEVNVKTFEKLNDEMRKKYPLLFKTNCGCSMANCNPNSSSELDNELAKELAGYINLVDCYS